MAATSVRAFPVHEREALPRPRADWRDGPAATPKRDVSRAKRIRSLAALFGLYTVALVGVMTLSDGADIGCILAGIAAHVFYATVQLVNTWRDDAWTAHKKARIPYRVG